MAYRIMLTGGGSGGHVYPLIAVAEELQRQAMQKGLDLELRFLGADGLMKDVATSIGIKFQAVISPKWRRYNSVQNFIDILKAPIGLFQTLFYVWRYMPDLIFSKGGYDSFLPALAGRIFRIPIVIHESDVIPGKANRWVEKWAKKVFVSFDAAKSYFKQEKTELVGNPMRSGLLNFIDRSVAVAAFGLDPSKPVVLITGASQGSQVINEALLLSLVELTKKFQVIHQCGFQNYEQVNAQILKIVDEGEGTYGKIITDGYRLYPILDLQQMMMAYSAADIIVSRAGAGSIFEIAAVGKPAVVIPLKSSASNHQLANAREFAKYGAIVIEEDNLTSHILINEITNAYDGRIALSQKIKGFAKPNAAQLIAQQLLAGFT